MTKAVNSKAWDLPVEGGRRYSNQSEPPPGAWADIIIDDIEDLAAGLAIDGQTVGLRVGNDFTGLNQNLTPGNGATMSIVTAGSGGSYNGLENGVRINPPTALVGENADYAGWGGNSNLWNTGSKDIYQMNFRAYRFYGSTYATMAPPAKCWGFTNSTVLGPGGDENNRIGVYDNYDPGWSTYRYPLVIAAGGPGYYNPPVYADPPTIPDAWIFIDSGPDNTKLCQIGGSTNHALTPPRTNAEWVCCESMFDLRRDRGNPDGIHRLKFTWSDGTERILEYPLNWDIGWDFATRYCFGFEGIGFYWNTAGTADANNYIIDTMPTFAANMAEDAWIGPGDFLD